jgi:beta-N-acetylhexosaminidase
MAGTSHAARERVVTAGVFALLLCACGGTTTNDAKPSSALVKPSAASSAPSTTPVTTPAASPTRLGVRQVPPPRVATPATTPAASPTPLGVRQVPPPRVTTPPVPATEPLDPQNWSSRQLAAELVMTGAKMGDTAAIERAAAKGVGGVVLFGPSSPDLARTLTRARAAAPRGNAPLIASDEEGGQVQRLTSLIYPLASAETMGRWSPARITETARRYALRMRALGVSVALAPDADIAVPGYFISATHRSFSKNPRQVGVAVNAWNDGLRAAGVLGVMKHWPGHGQASDTHKRGSSVPPWSVLQDRDLIPFKAAFAHHAGAVMVGHLRVPGLTEGSLPASESPAAMRALRAQAGAAAFIVTDDLSMAAASTTLGITAAQAAVRSLVAGADVAMVCFAPVDAVISAVAHAINDGQLPRARAVASARRVLRIKMQVAVPR